MSATLLAVLALLGLCLTAQGNLTVRLIRDDNIASTPIDKPQNPTRDTTARFIFEVPGFIDPLPFECQLDGQNGWTPCTSPVFRTGLLDGPHTFAVRVPGNAPTVHTWTIDTIVPTVTLADFPPKLSAPLSRNRFVLSASEPVLFQCSSNAQPEFARGFVPCNLAFNSSVLSLSLTSTISLSSLLTSSFLVPGVELKSGRYNMSVRAVDEALNISPIVTYEWSVDPCVPQGKCREKTCNAGACQCGQGYYLDFSDDHLCRTCETVIGCSPSNVHCTNGIDSLCGSCTTSLSVDRLTNSFACDFVVNWN